MKGSKEGKGDGVIAAGPALFPRLHVAETKKAGPRGPPRNKMALYEQLTIPSHRYKPTPVPLPSSGRVVNGSMTTPIYQPQVQGSSYDSRYSYMPMSYMSPIIPTMAYMPMMNVGVCGGGGGGGGSATSSMNASSTRSTVVDAGTESQRVPRGGEALSRRQNSSGQSRPSAGSKKGKEDDDFAVPTYSATQASSQTRVSTRPFQVQQGLRGGRIVEKGMELVMEKRSGACVDQVRRMRKERSMEDDASWTSASVECVTFSAVDDDGYGQELRNRKVDGGRRDCDGGEVERYGFEIGQERAKERKVEGLTKQSKTTSSAGGPAEVVHQVDSLRAVPERDVFSGQSSENQSGEVSEPSQPRRGTSAETELSMLENLAGGPTCFRDVVDAFGQQEFWKAQSTIIRQQKLFARQLFELHRVIEVQQLLAKTSSLSLNIDEVLEEEEADNLPTAASPVADVPEVPEVPERGVGADGSQSSDENSRPVPEAVCQPIYPLSVPSQQDFNSGSAWQAAPFGANPWAARMSSPFMYVPYPGPCSPGYGVYPTMGAPMSMYGNSGDMQAARFWTWPQAGMSQPWRAQESVAAAAAAWYGQQPVVPAVGLTATMGIVSGACNSERPTSCAANQAVQGSNASKESGGQSREGCDVGANRSNKGNAVKKWGWAKGWGSVEERSVVRGEAEASRSKECVAGPSGYEGGRREGEVGRGDGGCGIGQQSGNGEEVGEREGRGGEASGYGRERVESESDRRWAAGARQEGAVQSRTLKRPRTEVPDCEVSPWFRIMSPSKQVTQQNGVIKVVPRAVSETPESAASILLSIQKERQR